MSIVSTVSISSILIAPKLHQKIYQLDWRLDHSVIIWNGSSDFSVNKNSCKVEDSLYDQYTEDLGNSDQDREKRPSDHRPMSVVLRY